MGRVIPVSSEADLVERLRAGDEAAFAHLVDTYYATMLRVARGYVASKEAAEDVVQEALLGVVEGIDRFEARSSLKTWMFRILVNRAKTRGEREGRQRPFSSLAAAELERDEPVVDPDRFAKEGRWVGHWTAPPTPHGRPEATVVANELGDELARVIATLPATQRLVIELRDCRGFSSGEVCELLELSEANQRVLLHRARGRVRAALESYVDERAGSA